MKHCAKKIHLAMLLFLMLPCLSLAELVDFDVPSGVTLQVARFDADAETLLIWLPSERGFERGYTDIAKGISAAGQPLWVVDLHESYMIPTGRKSIEEFKTEDVLALMKLAADEGYRQVALFSGSRGTRLALQVTRAWQLSEDRIPRLVGNITQYPNLLVDGRDIGEQAIYRSIAKSTNVPVYLLHVEFSTKYAHREAIVAALETGGASVFRHELKGVQGGFHVRPEEELTQTDLEARKKLPGILKNAVKLLAMQPTPQKAASLPESEVADTAVRRSSRSGMRPFVGDPVPPRLNLPQMGGEMVSMKDWQGETVLLNFWATWCGPCVREIPSLARLQEKMKGKPFRIVSVNIGETEERIKAFAKEVPIEFPVLLDEAGTTARDWKVYAYPSNYLISPEGTITHAYRGALEWDEPEVVESILGAMKVSM